MATICPDCRRRVYDDVVHCRSCGTALASGPLEEFGHLTYMRSRLRGWERQDALTAEAVDRLMAITAPEVDRLARLLSGARPGSPNVPLPLLPRDASGTLLNMAAQHPHEGGRDARAPAGRMGLHGQPTPPDEARSLAALEAFPAPARERFSWAQLGASLLSERTLHALRALGAILILTSAMVIAVVNPTRIGPWTHLAALLLTTAAFAGSGYLVRQRLRLPLGGGTLLLIAAALLPFAVWSAGQPALLNWPAASTWLIASLVCAPVYLAFHRILDDRPSAALVAVAGGDLLLAVLNALGVTAVWDCAALAVLAIGYLALARVAHGRRANLAWALFWSAHLTVPAVVVALTIARLAPAAWAAVLGYEPGALTDYAAGLAWWLGVVFYALAARIFSDRRYGVVAAWTLPAAVLLTLTKLPWDASWYGLCLALLAVGYAAFLCWTRRGQAASSWRDLLASPASQVGGALSVLAAVWPAQRPDSAVPTLILLALTQGVVALALRQEGCAYLASWLMAIAFAVELPWVGLSATVQPIAWTLFAILYVAAGVVVRRRAGVFRAPLLVTGYVLSLAALLSTTVAATPTIAVFALCLGLYAVSAWFWPQVIWRYLVAVVAPLLLGQVLDRFLLASLLGPAMVALGLASSLMARWLQSPAANASPAIRRSTGGRRVEPFDRANHALNAVGILLAAAENSWLILAALALTALHYGLLAWRCRQPRFAYPLAAALAGAYAVALAIAELPRADDALALLPGCAAALLVAAVFRRADRRRIGWSTPFLLVVIGGIAMAVVLAWPSPMARAVALGSAALILGGCGATFRHPAWLYPTIATALGAYLAAIVAAMPGIPWPLLAATLVVPAWLLGWFGYALARLASRLAPTSAWARPTAGHPLGRWAAPLCRSGLGAAVLAIGGSVTDSRAGLAAAASSFVLLALLASLWRSDAEVWDALACAAVALAQALRLANVPLTDWTAMFALALLAGSLLALALGRRSAALARLWAKPLAAATLWASGAVLPVAAAMPQSMATREAIQALALAVALSGLALVAHAYRLRQRVVCYAGVALVVLGILVELGVYGVGQPQAFALPVGVYLLTIAYLEWRRDHDARGKAALELTAIGVLLGVTALQAHAQFGAGFVHPLYGTVLIVQSLIIFGLGAMLRWKRSFFGGAAGVVAGVLILLIDPLHAVNTWYLLTAIGCGMVALVVLAERQRQRIPLWFDAWQARLEAWD